MATLTPNFDLIKPGVNDATDQDLWGGYLNDSLDIIDTVMKSNQDLATGLTDAITSNYTVLEADQGKVLLVDATSGNITITLPDVTSLVDGFKIGVKKIDGTANLVTIDANGSQTIDNVTTYVIATQNSAVTLTGDTTEWYIVSSFRTGGYINKVVAQDYTVSTTTNIIPDDDTIPQSTEGLEIITATITPTSATNRLLIKATCNVSFVSLGQVQGCIALFKDSDTSAIAASAIDFSDNTVMVGRDLFYEMAAGTTSAITFKIRVGSTVAGTVTVNGSSGSRKFGGVMGTYLEIIEVSP